ncbi:hypothetical protein LG311_14225 [Sutcliffiella horikoshii]|uniref:hypothetical protein n=1 Tax=Sutcliffiella horikoshii TaxID=79883 RepID=UPI001CC198D9|nr:hypothetical protein [Sutcliffiella horikoshii]UAL46064.1 hypothetical protein K7887_14130 [Sutcliffiella horikoshii]
MKKWWILVLASLVALTVYFTLERNDLFYVEVTIPSSLFISDINEEELISSSEKEGILVTKHEDGSMTYRMNRLKHYEKKAEYKNIILHTIQDIIADDEYYEPIYDVTHNKSLNQFTFFIDKSKSEGSLGLDRIVSLLIGMNAALYQLYNGASLDNYHVNVRLQDKDTDEIISETTLP